MRRPRCSTASSPSSTSARNIDVKSGRALHQRGVPSSRTTSSGTSPPTVWRSPTRQTAQAHGCSPMRPTATSFVDPMLREHQPHERSGFGLGSASEAGQPGVDQLASARPTTASTRPVAYKGAFDANDLWLADGHCLRKSDWCRPTRRGHTIQVTGQSHRHKQLVPTNSYVLNGFIYVLSGGVAEH